MRFDPQQPSNIPKIRFTSMGSDVYQHPQMIAAADFPLVPLLQAAHCISMSLYTYHDDHQHIPFFTALLDSGGDHPLL